MSYAQKNKKNSDHPGHRVSLSVVLLGVSLATGLPSYYYGDDLYKKAACLGKVLGFAQRGIIRDGGRFNGGIFECSHIQWSGSIYE
jgi:hypothetical protein